MKLADREEQIIRIQSQSFQPELTAELEETLKREVVGITQVTIETALIEELEAERDSRSGTIPRRSGYFTRVLDTEYGRIEQLKVPKLRWGNKEREGQILERYQRGLNSLLNFALCLYVMG
jgi:transposase-like protein